MPAIDPAANVRTTPPLCCQLAPLHMMMAVLANELAPPDIEPPSNRAHLEVSDAP